MTPFQLSPVDAAPPAPLSIAPAARPTVARSLLLHAGLVGLALAAIGVFGPMLGMTVPTGVLALLGIGALLVEAFPAHAYRWAAACGVVLLVRLNPTYSLYHLALVAALFSVRRSPPAMALVLAAMAIAVPKQLFRLHYHSPGHYNWINEASLGAAILATLYWWRERRDRRLPPGAEASPIAFWGCFFFFPSHALNPLTLGPAEIGRDRRGDVRLVLQGIALVTGKALVRAALAAAAPQLRFARIGPSEIAAFGRGQLWLAVAINYVDLVLALSGTADLAILLARVYGWPLQSPFRWALLAWNPVELWRRWNIYNRRFLLKCVYFPLGGARRRFRNVMLTFLASALVLHTGWFGSKYWSVGPGGLRDQLVYFGLQGLAVCACLGWWRVTRRDPGADRALRWSGARVAGTLATQALSALLHVIVLPQQLAFADRWHVIARCLGG